jgi:DNA repair exonuclease SbcCD nuclease subunit
VIYLCCGDLHLGSSPDFGNHPGERLADQRRVWLALCKAAVRLGVDGVLFAGDAFHRRRPTPAELVAFKEGLDYLDAHGVPIIGIVGNHDVSSIADPSAPGVLDGYAQWHAHRAPDVLTFQPRVSAPRAEVEPVLPASELVGMDWAGGIVCGHIHKPQHLGHEVTGHRAFFYTGSPLAVDFGEWDSDHGFWVLDTGVGAEFTRLGADRPFRSFDIDLREDYSDAPGVDLNDVEGAIVRVRVRCDEQQRAVVDPARIRAKLYEQGAHRVYQVAVLVEKAVREQRQVDEQAEPLAAFEAWCASKGIDDAEWLVERTRTYLAEVAG